MDGTSNTSRKNLECFWFFRVFTVPVPDVLLVFLLAASDAAAEEQISF